jgi:cutinase
MRGVDMSSTTEIAAVTASRTNTHGLSRVASYVAVAATLACNALLIEPPPSRADEPVLTAGSTTSCPDVQLVFARGTGEEPGAGRVGDAFADSLRSLVNGRSVAVYGVQYPASYDFMRAIDAVDDAAAFMQNTAQACPQTQMVLGRYSQGAAVVDVLAATDRPILGFTSPLPDAIADHVAAVVVFGNPSNRIGEPLTALSPLYGSRAIDLCNGPDPVCSDGNDVPAHSLYLESGIVDQAAEFAAAKLSSTHTTQLVAGRN